MHGTSSSRMMTIGPILIDAPVRREIASGVGNFGYGSRAASTRRVTSASVAFMRVVLSLLRAPPGQATGCSRVIMPFRISAATGTLNPGISRVPISIVAFRTFPSARVSRYFVDSNGRNAARYTLIRGGPAIVASNRGFVAIRGVGMALLSSRSDGALQEAGRERPGQVGV